MGSNEIRKSADASILLVNQYSGGNICGVNWFNMMDSGYTLGTVRKGCALGYYSFGHEIGHGFGLNHDRRKAGRSSTSYSYGMIIKRGRYRSIMAYNFKGEKRINYYSNPKVSYQGYPTGKAGSEDNARVLTENRYRASRIGDERITCSRSTGGPVVPAGPVRGSVTFWSKENNRGVPCKMSWNSRVTTWKFKNGIPCKEKARSVTIEKAKRGTRFWLADKPPGGKFNDHLTINVKRDISYPYKITTLNGNFDDGTAEGKYVKAWVCGWGCGLNGHMSYARVTET